MNKRIAVIGGGAFGTAISTVLVESGCSINLWCYEESVVSEIQDAKRNVTYLPDIPLSEKIHPTSSLKEALEGVDWVFVTIPVKFLRSVLELAKDHLTKNEKWVLLSKGIEQGTLMLPSQILDDVLDYKTVKFALSGPNFARELAEKFYSGASLAYEDEVLAKELQSILSNKFFKPYLTSDLIGVQVCGALKNIFALITGIAIGAGFKDNTKAFLLTIGFSEMGKLVEHLGGNHITINGFSGFGDLVLTCTGSLGRNLKAGIMFGEGLSLDEIEETGITAEGVNTIKSLQELISKDNLDLPLCSGIYQIIFMGKNLRTILNELMLKPSGHEFN
ncbi:NAD(P)-dependent glycerol-3-phosphate dehydrogenase [Candidatus Babeliales bacterium]|nr:NAD(P)-dependent glycerol-3-phosphate dehydrogenase [Candidatus Babeliales bacterium]